MLEPVTAEHCRWFVAEIETICKQLEESKEREKNLVSAVEEALGWNWLGEDIPLDVYEQIIEIINDSKES